MALDWRDLNQLKKEHRSLKQLQAQLTRLRRDVEAMEWSIDRGLTAASFDQVKDVRVLILKSSPTASVHVDAECRVVRTNPRAYKRVSLASVLENHELCSFCQQGFGGR